MVFQIQNRRFVLKRLKFELRFETSPPAACAASPPIARDFGSPRSQLRNAQPQNPRSWMTVIHDIRFRDAHVALARDRNLWLPPNPASKGRPAGIKDQACFKLAQCLRKGENCLGKTRQNFHTKMRRDRALQWPSSPHQDVLQTGVSDAAQIRREDSRVSETNKLFYWTGTCLSGFEVYKKSMKYLRDKMPLYMCEEERAKVVNNKCVVPTQELRKHQTKCFINSPNQSYYIYSHRTLEAQIKVRLNAQDLQTCKKKKNCTCPLEQKLIQLLSYCCSA